MVFGLFLLYLIIIAKCSYQVLSSIIGRFYGTNLLLSSFCKVIFTVYIVLFDVQYFVFTSLISCVILIKFREVLKEYLIAVY